MSWSGQTKLATPTDSCPSTMQTWWHIVTVMNIEAFRYLQLSWKCGGQSVCCLWVFNIFLERMNSVASGDHPLHWTPNFTKLFQKLREETFGTALNWETLMKRSRHFGRMSILMETSGWGPIAKLDLRKISSANTRMINTIAENAIWRWSFCQGQGQGQSQKSNVKTRPWGRDCNGLAHPPPPPPSGNSFWDENC